MRYRDRFNTADVRPADVPTDSRITQVYRWIVRFEGDEHILVKGYKGTRRQVHCMLYRAGFGNHFTELGCTAGHYCRFLNGRGSYPVECPNCDLDRVY